MDCPYLNSESKGWFGYENTCEVLGIKIGDEHDRTKVEELCESYEMPFEDIQAWYDGYNVDGVKTYNPRSVVMSVTGHRLNNYWTQTETFEALKVYIEMDFDGSFCFPVTIRMSSIPEATDSSKRYCKVDLS